MTKTFVGINDTLKLTKEQGLPKELNLEKHQENPFSAEDFKNKMFKFHKPKRRIYPFPPTRTFLVEGREGKWIYWGHVMILEQTINSESETTTGKFKIVKIYDPEYQRIVTENESPEGKSYF